jgi:ketosteroid isomerase-like protein
MEGQRVLIAPNRPSEGVTVAFIERDGAPVESLRFDQNDEQEVRAAFEKARTAMFAGDREALESLFAEDYRSVSIHGTASGREEVLATFGMGLVLLERFDATDLTVRIDGNTGILRGEGIVAGSFAGQTFEHQVRFCDIYERSNGRWQIVFSQMTEVRGA